MWRRLIRRAIIAAAGLGTRLLPATKEQPKEMLPVYSRGADGTLTLKPIVQLIYEQLYDLGVREFCIVIGRGKRVIEDHFTQDYPFASYLRKRNCLASAEELERFYRRLDDSLVSWVMQPEPKGFGDAALRARKYIGDNDFVLQAGDAYIISKGNSYFRRLETIFQRRRSSGVLVIHQTTHPHGKGIAEVRLKSQGLYEVISVVEKPRKPRTDVCIEPIYMFRPHFFHVLERVKPGKGGEIQVTDAIQLMISDGKNIHATRLLEGEVRLDVGDAESYWDAFTTSFRLAKN
jgi:UTP--glucose-1-phosphate uridylyltransferase